jgi:hypothetical protein
MRTIETTVYQFKELSDDAKAKALESLYDINLHDDWHEFLIDDFKANSQFDVTKVYFSGFSSQGDGAMMEYQDVKFFESWVDSLDLPNWKKEVLKACEVSASGKHRGHYYHSGCCEHSFSFDYPNDYHAISDLSNVIEFIYQYMERFEEEILDRYSDECGELYNALEREYEWMLNEEQVIESIESNGYEFTEEGEII